jgi:hypothetical protein
MAHKVGNITKKVRDGDTRCIYLPTGSPYEKGMIEANPHIIFSPLTPNKYNPMEGLNFDFIVSQSIKDQLPAMQQLAHQLHLPILSIEHSLLDGGCPRNLINPYTNVYSSEACKSSWQDMMGNVIPELLLRENDSIVSSITNHRVCVYSKMNIRVDSVHVTDNLQDVADSSIYLDINDFDYVEYQPMLLAMKYGRVIIAKNNPVTRQFVLHGVTGFVYDDSSQINKLVEAAAKIQYETVQKMYNRYFSREVLIKKWVAIMDKVTNYFYRGLYV